MLSRAGRLRLPTRIQGASRGWLSRRRAGMHPGCGANKNSYLKASFFYVPSILYLLFIYMYIIFVQSLKNTADHGGEIYVLFAYMAVPSSLLMYHLVYVSLSLDPKVSSILYRLYSWS